MDETLNVSSSRPNMHEDFEVIGKIESIETIAVGSSIRELHRLRRRSGMGGGTN
ncbi:MAG TPA: hypothetical protein VF397_09985 [Pyrinomonadaceae bacterium]